MQTNLHEAALRLRDNPAWLSPEERRSLVATIADAMLCGDCERDREVTDLIEQLAGDKDWSVRLEVARMVHLLSEDVCRRLVATFRSDCNSYVRGHAERSLARQRKVRQVTSRKRVASSNYGDQLDQLERQHGKRIAAKVRSLADQRYTMLASSVAHDVRSILTTLSANAAALSAEMNGNTRVRSIQEDIDHITRTIEGMEEYTNVLPIQRHHEDLAELLTQAIDKARGGVKRQKHDDSAVQITVSAPASIRVQVVRRLMVLALTNVIQNAIEAFADQDEDAITAGLIRIEAVVDGYEFRILVRDNGPGVEPEVLRELRAFTPCGRNKSKRRSSGWGLCLAHRYVAANGGTLAIYSEMDRGTEVIITLPMQLEDIEE